MSESLGRIIRDSGVLPKLAPTEALRQQEALRQIVDDVGRLSRAAVRPYLPPTLFDFRFDGTPVAGAVSHRRRAAQAGTLTHLAAWAETAPTSNCVLRLIDTDANTLATVTIPAGARAGESAGLAVPLLGGAWLAVVVDAAGGAVDISIDATERMD